MACLNRLDLCTFYHIAFTIISFTNTSDVATAPTAPTAPTTVVTGWLSCIAVLEKPVVVKLAG